MKKAFLCLLIPCLLILSQNKSAACWGFRAIGMGGIFTAVADDANAAYWNRAGLAQFDNWENGQSQIILTNHVVDNMYGLFTRKERLGNAYYDSFHYAMKINKNYGWSLSGEWSGGGAFALSPSFAFRLPWNRKMSIGIGYFLFRTEGYVQDIF
ncbi:MAG: hypothetical protein AABZ57_08385, partial [Candidatus Margulisiibacteriota bacterium]